MNDLATLPLSVRQQLERASQVPARVQPDDPRTAVQAVLRELAGKQPELCALLLASQMGYHELSVSQSEWSSNTERIDRRAFGFNIGVDETTTITERTVIRTLRLA